MHCQESFNKRHPLLLKISLDTVTVDSPERSWYGNKYLRNTEISVIEDVNMEVALNFEV